MNELAHSLWQVFLTVWQLVLVLGQLIGELLYLGLQYGAVLFLVAWFLWGVNWQKTWPVLRRGAGVPFVLLVVLIALVWSQIVPSNASPLGLSVPNFWWQLGVVGLLAGVALFCGWLQGKMNWTPTEISLEPPDHGHDHSHGHDSHGHGHDS
ncbi:MAG: hypothetical protein JNM56_07010, partial [Planctomycetia bacterium]|nr:hypothetical protein [Planctomycetia bacterium]